MNKDAIYFIASIIGISSFFLTDILLLRSLYLVSSILFVLSGIIFDLDIIIIMNIFYALVNLVQIIILLRKRSTFSIPKFLRYTYQNMFSIMTPYEFNYLVSHAKRLSAESGSYLVHENTEPKKLLFIYKGNMQIEKANKVVTQLDKRTFIGEISYVTGQSITADVKTLSPVEYLEWNFETLSLLKKNKDLYMKFLGIICKDLIHKLELNAEKKQHL